MIRLLRFANSIDHEHPDLADRLERLADAQRVIVPHFPVPTDIIRQCMFCHAIFDPDTEEWLTHPAGKLDRDDVSHGVCPDCRDNLLRKKHVPLERIAMRPLLPKDIVDRDAYESLKRDVGGANPIQGHGKDEFGHPLFTVHKDLPGHHLGGQALGGDSMIGGYSDLNPRNPLGTTKKLWQTLGLQPKETAVVGGPQQSWNMKHELQHLADEPPLGDVTLRQKRPPTQQRLSPEEHEHREMIRQQLPYLMKPGEADHNVVVALDFIANKGSVPPKGFHQEEQDENRRTIQWVAKYSDLPFYVINRVLKVTKGLRPDQIQRLMNDREQVAQIADQVRTSLFKLALKRDPWLAEEFELDGPESL